jgi:mevalonate kinase
MVADVKIKANTIDVSNYIKKLQKTIPRDITKALNKVSAYAVDQIQTKHKKDKHQMVGLLNNILKHIKDQNNLKRKKINLLT